MQQEKSIIHIIFVTGRIHIHGFLLGAMTGSANNQEPYAQVFAKIMVNTKTTIKKNTF
jgi:hypothetical protein